MKVILLRILFFGDKTFKKCKKACLISFMIVLGIVSVSRAATITTTGSGNWSSTTPGAPWPGGTIPAVGDDIVIGNGFTLTVDGNRTCLSMRVGNGSTLTVNATFTLTITNGLTFPNLANAAATGTVAGAGAVSCASVSVGGTTAPTGNSTTTVTSTVATLNSTGAITLTSLRPGASANNPTFQIQSGTVTATGTLSCVTANNAASTTLVTLQTGAQTGTLRLANATPITISGNAGIPTFSFNGTGSTVDYSGAAQTIRPVAYRNLTLSGSGAKTQQAGMTISGNLTMTGTATTTTVANLSIGANLDIGNGTTFTTGNNFTLGVTGTTTVGGGTSGSLVLGGTGTKTFTGDVDLNANSTWNETGNAAINFAGSLTNDAGTFTSNAGTHTFTGATKTLSGGQTTSIPTVVFSNTSSYTNSGTLSTTSLTITSPGSLANNGTVTASTTLGGIGALTQGATGVLNIGGTSTVTLSATTAGNTVNYTGAAQTVLNVNYHHLGMSGSGAKGFQPLTTSIGGNLTLTGTASTSAVVALAIGGNLSLGNGTALDVAAAANFSVGGTTTVGGGASGALTISSTGTKTFTGDVTLNAGSTWDETAAATVNYGGSLTNNAGNFIASTGTHSFTGATKTLGGSTVTDIPTVAVTGSYTNNGTLTVSTDLSGAGSLTQGAAGVLNIGGTSTLTTLTATAVGNSVTFNGASQTVNSTNYYNLSLSGSGAKTLQSGTTAIGGNLTLGGTASATAVAGMDINGAVTIGAGSELIAGAFTHTVAGNWTNNGVLTSAGSTINFDGAGQTIGGTLATTFNNLTLSGSGVKALTTTPSITGNFTMGGTASTAPVGAVTVGGAFTLGTGTTFTAGPYVHNVAGNWINNGGTFTNTGSTINLNGSGQSVGGTNSTTFNNLSLTGSGTKTFSMPTFTAGNLSVASGVVANLSTHTTHTSNTLTLGGAGQVGGTWGGTSSAATNINSTYFATATGILTVTRAPITFYSRATGNWNANATWSTVTYGGAAATAFPAAGDIVNIGGSPGYTVTVNVNSACASLSYLATQSYNSTVSISAGVSLTVSGDISLPTANGSLFGTDYTNTLAVGAGVLTASSLDFEVTNILGGGNSLTISTGTATISGDVTDGFLTGTDITFTGSGLLRIGGAFQNTITANFTPSTGTVEYFGTVDQQMANFTYYNLTLSGSGVKTVAAAMDINGTLTLGAGTSFTSGGYSHSLAGNWVNNGAIIDNSNSTFTLDGGAQTIGGTTATTFNNLTLSGGTKSFGYSTTMDGLLTINTGAQADLGSLNHTARALTLTTTGQGPSTYGSTGSSAAVQNDTYFTAPQTGILTVTGRAFFSRASGDWNTAATWSNTTYGGAAGTLTPGAADVVNIGGGNYAITVGANSFCYSLSYQPNTTNDPTLTINAGTLTVSSSINIPSGGGLFGAGVNTLAVGAGSLVAGSLEFSTGGLLGGHALTIASGTATINGDVTQGFPNATVSFSGAGHLRLRGAFLNSNSCNFTAGTGTVHYESTSKSQTVGDFTFYRLEFNNTYGTVPQLTLYGNATVSNTLTMTSGIINLNSLTLILGTAISAGNNGTLGYTSGWMYGGTFRRYFNESTPVTLGTVNGLFPMGTISNYRPLYLGKPNLNNTGGALNVSHNGSDNGSVAVNFADDNGTVVKRHNSFWTLSKATGMGGIGNPYSIQAGGTGFGTIEEVDDLRLTQVSSEVGTTSLPNSGTTTSPLVNKISIANANLANNYYIGSVDDVNSPLPIELLSFTATLSNDVVRLDWSTASEINNAFFIIERASDIENFEAIGEPIDGAGTTKVRHDYSLIDENPLYGRSYYRLKQTDFDGQFTYSDVRVVDYDGPKFASLRAYPNPSDGSRLTVLVTGLKEQSSVPLQIYNVQGQMVFQGTFDVDTPGTLKKDLEFGNPLRSGMYLIKAGQTLQLTQKIFIE